MSTVPALPEAGISISPVGCLTLTAIPPGFVTRLSLLLVSKSLIKIESVALILMSPASPELLVLLIIVAPDNNSSRSTLSSTIPPFPAPKVPPSTPPNPKKIISGACRITSPA